MHRKYDYTMENIIKYTQQKSRKVLIYSLFVMTSLLISGCEQYELGSPAASTISDFTYTATNGGKAPCTVTFTNKSLNAKGYLWDFGNGITSNEANPVIEFVDPGLFTVKLTCIPNNDVHYNSLVKSIGLNIKDPNAGQTQVLYFTSRSPEGGGAHYVILDDNAPVVQDFESVPFSRPYGIAADTLNKKVYVSDYSEGVIYRFNADGTNPEKILDASVSGQELTGSPEALFILGDKLYWGTVGGINRANLDGSNPEEWIATGSNAPEFPIDMQYDPLSNKIYLVNDKTDYSGGFFSMNLDGSAITEHILDIDGTALEADFVNGKIYMAIYGPEPEDGIYMCNLDGSSLTKIGDYGSKATWGIGVDNKNNKIFWSYKISNADPDGKIIRANLNGSGAEDWITGVSPHAIQVVFIKL
jgi:DNA-binding beta-propeller fold protein YncE